MRAFRDSASSTKTRVGSTNIFGQILSSRYALGHLWTVVFTDIAGCNTLFLLFPVYFVPKLLNRGPKDEMIWKMFLGLQRAESKILLFDESANSITQLLDLPGYMIKNTDGRLGVVH